MLDQSPIAEEAVSGSDFAPKRAAGLSFMKSLVHSSLRRRAAAIILPMVMFFPPAFTPPPAEVLTLQCISGTAVWTPIVLDTAHPLIGGYPVAITATDIRWETITRNGF